jgi:hypothetical protein
MESTQQSGRDTFRAIVLAQNGNELLLAPAGDRFVLPSVEIPCWQRVAENLTTAMREKWGREVVCLFSPNAAVPAGFSDGPNYQVMECRGSTTESGLRAEWVHVASLSERVFSDPADYVVVQRSLSECTAVSRGATQGPFSKLGWLRELQEWIEGVIAPLGFHLTGGFSQFNASPSFSLVRFETSGPAVWFKAVGKPNLREYPITLALSELVPRYLPSILAARPECNGWLALEVEGFNLGETQDTRHWTAAASALAMLQIDSIGKFETLVHSGARDLRVSSLSLLVRPFLHAMDELMRRQTKVPPTVLSRSELVWLGERIEGSLSLSRDLGIPDSLGHLDLNPWNVIVSEGQCVFLDWAEGYLGNPLFSFQYLFEHSRRIPGFGATTESVLTSSYGKEWQSLVSPGNLQEALALTPMLAAFAYAVATDAWSDRARLQDPKVAGYLRSLTRRMHREGNRLRDRSAQCPN